MSLAIFKYFSAETLQTWGLSETLCCCHTKIFYSLLDISGGLLDIMKLTHMHIYGT